ncbi:NAD(P)/FAD-dependent oxidoreductase [Tardisphaera miroshnichenkoae]
MEVQKKQLKMRLRVAVVGAGPCGSLVGRLLAKRGHEVFLLEEHGEIGRPRHCTGLVSRDVPGYYGMTERKARVLEEFSEAELIYGNKSLTLELEPSAVALEREGFELELADMASEAGAQIRLGERVTHVRIDSEGRREVVSEARGAEEKLEVDAVVDCGGARDGLTGLQYEVEGSGPRLPQVYFERAVPREYFYWVVPQGEGRYLVGTAGRGGVKRKLDAFIGSQVLRERLEVTKVVRAFGGLVVVRPPRSPYSSRFQGALAAGDAANQVKITTGGGLAFAAASASALAGAIDRGEIWRYASWFKRRKNLIRAYAFLRQVYAWLPSSTMESAFNEKTQDYLTGHPLLFDQHWKYFVDSAPALLAALISRARVKKSGRI